MNKKLVMIIISIILLVCIILVRRNFTKKKKVDENIIKDLPRSYTYQKSEESSEDLYIIYDEEGNEVNSTTDEMLVDALMHLYEIDPNYDG